MNKEFLRKLATSDNIFVKYSGRNKIAYLIFFTRINANTANAYKNLFAEIGYTIQTNCSKKLY